jgi:hypothetical protein
MDQLPVAELPQSSNSFFDNVSAKLPPEIFTKVLEYWMALERLIVEDLPPPEISEPSHPPTQQDRVPDEYLITYACETDNEAQAVLPNFQVEYWRLRHLSWLTSPKVFNDPYNFYMSHYLLSRNLQTRVPYIDKSPSTLTPRRTTIHPLLVLPHPNIPTHGLEHIVLDFDAPQYFAFFNVRLPPFDITDTSHLGDELHHDQHLHGAASLLQHCTQLTLIFGEGYRYAHPWYNIQDSAWDEARSRPRVCEMGKIVDWILRYAWDGEWIQGKKLRLEGDVQGWVRDKWKGGSGEGIEGIEQNPGTPQDFFPPVCKCEVGCWTLGTEEDETVW